MLFLITGKQAAGKTHYALALKAELEAGGRKVYLLDGDVFRHETGNKDFSDNGRFINLMTAAELGARKEQEGYIVIMAFIAPKVEWRKAIVKKFRASTIVYLPGGQLWPGSIYEAPIDELIHVGVTENRMSRVGGG